MSSTDTQPAPAPPAAAGRLVQRTFGGVGRALPSVIAPIGALLVAAGISSLILMASGRSPGVAFGAMLDYAAEPKTITDIFNKAVPYYLSAVAVAIGFRMGLFNIGVEGQYRLAGVLAAGLGASSAVSWLPGPVRILVIVIVAMAVGAAWAGIAALLKIYRGVSEVISTIMLNFLAGSIFAFLLTSSSGPGPLGVLAPGGQLITTSPLPADTHLPGLPHLTGTSAQITSFLLIAAVLGVVYWWLLGRTRFGFDLRAAGMNPTAAVASGVGAKRMVIITMLISGGVAGLVSMPDLLGHDYVVNTSLGGLGFTGIAIALLGRNHPAGIALAALLWAFLDQTRFALDLKDIPKETIVIMQGITVIVVVVAYEVARRVSQRAQQRKVGQATGELGEGQ